MNPPAAAPGALSVVSAIVTPALLILACSSLITATSNRLNRLLDRVRDLTKDVEALLLHKETPHPKRELLISLLRKAAVRARLLQRVMVSLYASLGFLVFTSVIVGVAAGVGKSNPHLVLVSIYTAITFLFYASFLLVRESRIALSAVDAEMDYVHRLVAKQV